MPGKCVECHAEKPRPRIQHPRPGGQERRPGTAPKLQILPRRHPLCKRRRRFHCANARKNMADTCPSATANRLPVTASDSGWRTRRIPISRAFTRVPSRPAGHAATCSSCHGSHDIYPATDYALQVNHWNVPATCGQCHKEIAREFGESVHAKPQKRRSDGRSASTATAAPDHGPKKAPALP